MAYRGLIHKYGRRMAISQSATPITLFEGDTPLIDAPRISAWVGGGAKLWLKCEGMNPTGSFKDRGMTAAVTEAVHHGASALICASTGNTAASAAAYAARAGITCCVLIPEGKIAMGKLAGAAAYGAQILAIDGSFDAALELVRLAAERAPIALVNSVNPARLQGQKTAAWEIVEQLGRVPDLVCLPVGNAGNISAYWLGFCENSDRERPKMLGAQAEGAAPIVRGEIVREPETRATAIRIGNPARWLQAEDAVRESAGLILSVTDEEIFEAYHAVAELEGVFCEPSSAAGIAGLRKAMSNGDVDARERDVVCVLTGHGLKDPDSVFDGTPKVVRIGANLDELLRALASVAGVPA